MLRYRRLQVTAKLWDDLSTGAITKDFFKSLIVFFCELRFLI
jgi:hypothetical protein